MYAVSQAYREAMKKPVQRHSIKGTVNSVPFTRYIPASSRSPW